MQYAKNNSLWIQHRFKAGYFYPKLLRPHCYDNENGRDENLAHGG